MRLAISGAHFDMARNEADVAVTAISTPPETLVGQRVAPFDYVVCGAASTHALAVLVDPDQPLASEVWLLTHPDLRASARVKAFKAVAAPYRRKRLAATP